jgi:hypothetical protein
MVLLVAGVPFRAVSTSSSAPATSRCLGCAHRPYPPSPSVTLPDDREIYVSWNTHSEGNASFLVYGPSVGAPVCDQAGPWGSCSFGSVAGNYSIEVGYGIPFDPSVVVGYTFTYYEPLW